MKRVMKELLRLLFFSNPPTPATFKGASKLSLLASIRNELDFFFSNELQRAATNLLTKKKRKVMAAAVEHKKKGNRLFDREDYKGAENAYSEAIELEPSRAGFWANRALARIRLGDWDGATEDCNKVLSMQPDNAKAYARLGRCLFEQGNILDADESYKKAAELDPHLTELKSRWRVDLELDKLRDSADSSLMLKAMRESKSGIRDESLERMQQRKQLAPLWRDLKPNPAFLWQSSDGLDRLEADEEMLATPVDNGTEFQRAYNVGELISAKNDNLNGASELLFEYEDDPPDTNLETLFQSKKTVHLWTGRAWKLHEIRVCDSCIFVRRIGFFVLDEFDRIFTGRTYRGNHFIALDRRSDLKILALVFIVDAEHKACLGVMNRIFKPKKAPRLN